MSPAFDFSASSAWQLFTRLGEAQILLPAMLVALLWLVVSERATGPALWWLVGTGVVAVLTTVSKVAFFGFEVGYAPLDYTGISGHAMFAAAVLPVLAAVAGGAATRQWRVGAIVVGYALALLVAYSRVRVGAHSVSEAVSGCVLGSIASALVLRWCPLPLARPPMWLAAVLALWMLSLPLSAPPSQTHDWVVSLSLAVSDRAEPYRRWQMHRDYRRQQQRRSATHTADVAAPPRALSTQGQTSRR
jgi:membrane-associated phospholipid phosphatase